MTEPSSAAEPSTPPTAPAPIPRLQTPYELGWKIIQLLYHFEKCNAHRFQWIVARFKGKDPGPPPPNTPEPEAETEELAPEEPAAKAGQAVEPPEQTPAKPTVEYAVVQRVEELVAGVEQIVEMAAEPADQAVDEPAAETTIETS
ncbi:uncharacterized protein LOC107633176 [Arachis ipaensis]|uniref:uncharacterized protein LOC107633176 n=1 Tax=Arachis ipaensis TaxID=130454 RepID=UPI0007AF173C|nr:uncharacterized protein LOC107633176 [Arachis ipaensis]XP_025640424.1 uncharacterized protein LOC112735070 [Arachis hypogaea]